MDEQQTQPQPEAPPTPQPPETDLIPITEAVEIIPPTKEYKQFERVPLQVLETITIPEIAVLLNALGIAVNSLAQARLLTKYPNIILFGFNSEDYAPAEEPFL